MIRAGQKISKDDIAAIDRLEAEALRQFWRTKCRCGHMRKHHGSIGVDKCDRECRCSAFQAEANP